jgi:uncharacterized membrane protein
MKLGWTGLAKIIYLIYTLECHQLPERSYFLFGQKMTYSLSEIQAAWQPTNNPLILRQFVGNQQMGWKVAWCERTTWWYGSIWVTTLVYSYIRRHLSPLTFRAFVLSALPMAWMAVRISSATCKVLGMVSVITMTGLRHLPTTFSQVHFMQAMHRVLSTYGCD